MYVNGSNSSKWLTLRKENRPFGCQTKPEEDQDLQPIDRDKTLNTIRHQTAKIEENRFALDQASKQWGPTDTVTGYGKCLGESDRASRRTVPNKPRQPHLVLVRNLFLKAWLNVALDTPCIDMRPFGICFCLGQMPQWVFIGSRCLGCAQRCLSIALVCSMRLAEHESERYAPVYGGPGV